MARDLDQALAVAAVQVELGRLFARIDRAAVGPALVEIAAEAAARRGRSRWRRILELLVRVRTERGGNELPPLPGRFC